MWKVQLPDYPCEFIVKGFKTEKTDHGRPREILCADAYAIRYGEVSKHPMRDKITCMMLHDAIKSRSDAPERNQLKLYGGWERQKRALSKIEGAIVERLESAGR